MKKLFAFLVLTISSVAFANDELLKLIDDKVVVYVGSCHVAADQAVMTSNVGSVGMQPCVVGQVPGDEANHFILLYQNGEAHRLVKYHRPTRTQEVLWRDPESML